MSKFRKSTNRNTDRTSRPRPPKRFSRSRKEEPRLEPEEVEGMRLNKYVAHCGIASRREAAELIKQGQVRVNGAVVNEPGYQVQDGDVIEYKGKKIQPEGKKVYLLMNKPKDIITTVKDERGRRTVIDLIRPKVKERVFPVGRLDRGTTGLLLLTNDGPLAQKLAHPSHRVQKFYHVFLNKPVAKEDMERIAAGIELEDGVAVVDKIDYVTAGDRKEVGIELHIGKNRIIRRIFEHLGYEVQRLDRTYYAGLTKKDLPRGHFRHLTEQEIIMLKHFI